MLAVGEREKGAAEQSTSFVAGTKEGMEALLKLLDEAAVLLQVDLLDRLVAERHRNEACAPTLIPPFFFSHAIKIEGEDKTEKAKILL
jgi:hypothetical protein